MKLNGERTAVFRDERGHLHAVSAVCTHMGCVLGWKCGRPDLGLLVPRLPLHPRRRRSSWPRDERVGANSRLLTEQGRVDAAPAPSLPCGQTDLRTPKRIS